MPQTSKTPTVTSGIAPAYLSVDDAAVYTGLSRRTLYRYSALSGAGAIPVHRVGGRRLFKVTDLDAFMAHYRHDAA